MAESLADIFRRAQALLQEGEEGNACALLRTIIAHLPTHGPSHHLLGSVAAAKRDWLAALRHLDLARSDPATEARAEAAYRLALRNWQTALGLPKLECHAAIEALISADLWKIAEELIPGLLEKESQSAAAWTLMGRIADRRCDALAAEKAHRKAAALAPENPGVWINLGNAFMIRENMDEARQCFDRARDLAPDLTEALAAMASLELLLGNFEEGWSLYEYRLVETKRTETLHRMPVWNGELSGIARLIVYTEQGLGTIMLFCRLLPTLRQRGLWVVMLAPPALVKILTDAGVADEIHAWNSEDPLPTRGDALVSLMSLPFLLGICAENSHATRLPLFQVREDRIQTWRERLGKKTGPMICLHWQGNPGYQQDHWRSPPLAALAPLMDTPGIRWQSLQRGHGAGQLNLAPFRGRVNPMPPDADPPEASFADSMALLALSDLLITADSAMAHLAASMGRPVWLMLPRVPDWRWGLRGEATFWYPTMKLFRQDSMGDWSAPVSRIRESLHTILDSEEKGSRSGSPI